MHGETINLIRAFMSLSLCSHHLISPGTEDLKRPVTFDEWQTFFIATEAECAVEIYYEVRLPDLTL